MGILRHSFKSKFTQIPNSLILDRRLSPGAFRVCAYLFSKSEGWNVNNSDIKKKLDIKDDKTMAKYWKNLFQTGWVERSAVRDNGQFSGDYESTLMIPNLDDSHIGKKSTLGEKGDYNNTDILNNTNPPISPPEGDGKIGGQIQSSTMDTTSAAKERNSQSVPLKPKEDGTDEERVLFVFDLARRVYPGTKRGLHAEYDNFIFKCRKKKIDPVAALPEILLSIEYQKDYMDLKKSRNEFVPEWKNFQTWINNFFWEAEMSGYDKDIWISEKDESFIDSVSKITKILP